MKTNFAPLGMFPGGVLYILRYFAAYPVILVCGITYAIFAEMNESIREDGDLEKITEWIDEIIRD